MIRTKLLAVVLTLVAGAVAAYTLMRVQRDTWQSPVPVTIDTNQPIGSLYPAWWAAMTIDTEADPPHGLLLREGDILLSEDHLFEYRASDGADLKLVFDDWSAKLGDTVVSVTLDEPAAIEWVTKASDRQIGDLRALSVPGTVDDATRAALKRVAAVNPGVTLDCEDGDAIREAVPLFRPRAVFANTSLDPAALRLLGGNERLETLSIEASEPGSLEVLATLPGLRRLTLGDWNVSQAGPLPPGPFKLKSLVVLENESTTGGPRDLTPIGTAASTLEELSVIAKLERLDGLAQFGNLRTITFGTSEMADLSALAQLPKLRWIGAPRNLTQAQLDAIVASHPGLEVLDLSTAEGIKDLGPLRGLTGLRGLLLGGPYDRVEALRDLKSLRYVGYTKETFENMPDEVTALRAALPEALIVRLNPFCLGSGWLLLLLPVLGIRWMRRRRLVPETGVA